MCGGLWQGLVLIELEGCHGCPMAPEGVGADASLGVPELDAAVGGATHGGMGVGLEAMDPAFVPEEGVPVFALQHITRPHLRQQAGQPSCAHLGPFDSPCSPELTPYVCVVLTCGGDPLLQGIVGTARENKAGLDRDTRDFPCVGREVEPANSRAG